MDKDAIDQNGLKEQVLNEISIHRAIQHERIIRFEGYFEDPKSIHLVLELADTETLYSLLQEAGLRGFEEKRAAKVVTDKRSTSGKSLKPCSTSREGHHQSFIVILSLKTYS